MQYNPKQIEYKLHDIWHSKRAFEPLESTSMEKKYILSMFPYPSGAIHMGHVRNYCIGDVIARYYRMQGYNVLHPIGFDAFGMPAENAAIKHGIHPKSWTYSNMEVMLKELKTLGLSFSNERVLETCDETYSKYEQEFFIAMWKKGLVYRKKALLNWCPKDLTVLANEQVIDGRCWRCDTQVVQKEMYQYYLKITDYADELLDELDSLEGKWPSQVISMQRNWIGKSQGLEFSFSLSEDSKKRLNHKIESISVYTTRCDTIYGVSYCVIAPEHEIVDILIENKELDSKSIEKIKEIRNQTQRDRAMADKEGLELPISVLHPLSGKELPVWIGNFVLAGYGSGSVMSVPSHDERDYEFAKKYGLELLPVIESSKELYSDDGVLINSDIYSGLESAEARERISDFFIQSRGRNQSSTFKIVNNLRVDMLTAAENRKSWFAVSSVFQSDSNASFSFFK